MINRGRIQSHNTAKYSVHRKRVIANKMH